MWAKQSCIYLSDKTTKSKVYIYYFDAFHRKDSAQLVDRVSIVIRLLVKLAIKT